MDFIQNDFKIKMMATIMAIMEGLAMEVFKSVYTICKAYRISNCALY